MITENSIPEVIGIAKTKENRIIDVGIINNDYKWHVISSGHKIDGVKEKIINTLELDLFPIDIVKDEVNLILDFEECRFGSIDDKKIHIDFESSFVKEGKAQRGNEWHLDQLNGGKFARQYIFSSIFPTEFLLEQHLVTGFNTRFNGSNIWGAKDNEIILMNTKHIHRSPKVRHDCQRFFFRMAVVI